ncbi:putative membrane protein [Pelagirhabdus alkalitolerans]|uniref:Putative membrane protein n=1 Tax=Pelagirhabdus alkalitolerans TaxID=1612202 RepID=A0A1G6MUX7_9BACI|nr:phage holin family protein [Pelagirhabdus alkalitolerans]SDC59007.1 putative membrane protein [Pelagirhabdus alkalitolerans]
MTRWILSLILDAAALVVVAQLFEGFQLETFGIALLASLILSILNVIVKPILVILTLPITILSLGLFLFIINAITLMITQSIIGSEFVIEGFGLAIVASIVISIINLILNKLVKDTILLSK